LPNEANLLHFLGLTVYILFYKAFQDFIAHSEVSPFFPREQPFLIQIKTIITTNIANWADGFGYNIEPEATVWRYSGYFFPL
jgi:hypothetical protein